MSVDALNLDRQHFRSALEKTDDAHEAIRGGFKKYGLIGLGLLGAIVGGSAAYNEAVEAGVFEMPADGGILDAYNGMGDTLTSHAHDAWTGLRERMETVFGSSESTLDPNQQAPTEPVQQAPTEPVQQAPTEPIEPAPTEPLQPPLKRKLDIEDL